MDETTYDLNETAYNDAKPIYITTMFACKLDRVDNYLTISCVWLKFFGRYRCMCARIFVVWKVNHETTQGCDQSSE